MFVLTKRVVAAAFVYGVLTTAGYAETYRLIHAIGNTEHEAARDLSKAECEVQKKEARPIRAL